MGIWCAAVGAQLLSFGTWIGLLSPVQWGAAAALVFAAFPARRVARGPMRTTTIAITLLTTFGTLALSVFVLGRYREFALAGVCRSNLRGAVYGLEVYREQFGQEPPRLGALVEKEICSPSQFCCPWDARANGLWDDARVRYSSYEFRPLSDRAIPSAEFVVGFEREERHPLKIGVFRQMGRHVAFGDLSVRVLGAEEFQQALARDVALRAELKRDTP